MARTHCILAKGKSKFGCMPLIVLYNLVYVV